MEPLNVSMKPLKVSIEPLNKSKEPQQLQPWDAPAMKASTESIQMPLFFKIRKSIRKDSSEAPSKEELNCRDESRGKIKTSIFRKRHFNLKDQ
jgi:hypothetical protein